MQDNQTTSTTTEATGNSGLVSVEPGYNPVCYICIYVYIGPSSLSVYVYVRGFTLQSTEYDRVCGGKCDGKRNPLAFRCRPPAGSMQMRATRRDVYLFGRNLHRTKDS